MIDRFFLSTLMLPLALVFVVAAAVADPLPEGAAAAAAPVRGAKELFYDPIGGTVTSAAPLPPVPPRQATTAAGGGSPAGSSAHARSTARTSRRGSVVPTASSARRQASLPADPLDRKLQRAIGISYWIELVDASGGPGTQVTDARTFRSGERIRLHFRGNADGEVELIQLGASGMATVLFPDPRKGLSEGRLLANEERILPSEKRWFRFDATPGTERLLVLFARHRQDLERFPLSPTMDPQATTALVRTAQQIRGSKDLFVETDSETAAEIGTYGVNVAGQPVVLEIDLKHH